MRSAGLLSPHQGLLEINPWEGGKGPLHQGSKGGGAVVSAGDCGRFSSTSGHYCEWIWFLGHLMYSQGSVSTGFPVVWCILIFRIFLCIRIEGFNIWNVSFLIKGVDFAIPSACICIPTLRLPSWKTSREWLNLSVPLCLIPQKNTISNYLVEVFKEVIVWLHGCSSNSSCHVVFSIELLFGKRFYKWWD